MKPKFYVFHITMDGDMFISDSTLVYLDELSNYKEAMACYASAKLKEAM